MNADLRFGLVGFGLFGRHHADAIVNTDGAVLTAIAARSDATRAAANETHPRADIHADFHEMVARDDIDVVDIVVPNALHYKVARAALEAGKHVLLEKPMALTVAHCDELIALAERQGKVLAINHELRLSTLWGEVKRLIDAGRIGTPLYCLIELSRFPYRQGSDGWRYDPDRVGNWILEEPIHFFDLARWYLASQGEPVSVYARANACRPDRADLQDNFSAMVNFAGGAYAVVTQTLAAFGHHVSAKIAGTDGAIWAAWSAADARADTPTFSLRYGDAENVEEVPFEQVTGELVELWQQLGAVVCAVRDGTPPPATAQDGRASVRLCLAAQKSVQCAQPVVLA